MKQTSRDAAHVHESSHTCKSTTLHAWCSVCGTAQLARACLYACTHTHVHMYTHPHTPTQKQKGSPHVFMSSLPAFLSNKLSRLFLIFLSHAAFILSHVHHFIHTHYIFFLLYSITSFSRTKQMPFHTFSHTVTATHTLPLQQTHQLQHITHKVAPAQDALSQNLHLQHSHYNCNTHTLQLQNNTHQLAPAQVAPSHTLQVQHTHATTLQRHTQQLCNNTHNNSATTYATTLQQH